MSEIELRVNATEGVRVRVGERVTRNQVIGQKAEGSGEPVLCPVTGRVEKVEFDGESHEFIVSMIPLTEV